jgi:hypothetical protein
MVYEKSEPANVSLRRETALAKIRQGRRTVFFGVAWGFGFERQRELAGSETALPPAENLLRQKTAPCGELPVGTSDPKANDRFRSRQS